jgi:hypothetical protein
MYSRRSTNRSPNFSAHTCPYSGRCSSASTSLSRFRGSLSSRKARFVGGRQRAQRVYVRPAQKLRVGIQARRLDVLLLQLGIDQVVDIVIARSVSSLGHPLIEGREEPDERELIPIPRRDGRLTDALQGDQTGLVYFGDGESLVL